MPRHMNSLISRCISSGLILFAGLLGVELLPKSEVFEPEAPTRAEEAKNRGEQQPNGV